MRVQYRLHGRVTVATKLTPSYLLLLWSATTALYWLTYWRQSPRRWPTRSLFRFIDTGNAYRFDVNDRITLRRCYTIHHAGNILTSHVLRWTIHSPCPFFVSTPPLSLSKRWSSRILLLLLKKEALKVTGRSSTYSISLRYDSVLLCLLGLLLPFIIATSNKVTSIGTYYLSLIIVYILLLATITLLYI